MLINDILDLSKIESGTVVVDIGDVRMEDLQAYVERTFRHVAEAKSVDFSISLNPSLPNSVLTDARRLQQILKNLLANAFKFTHRGRVTLEIAPTTSGWSNSHEDLNRAGQVLAFSVTDTGVGISEAARGRIFEPFTQGDSSTTRRHAGTGLGLAAGRTAHSGLFTGASGFSAVAGPRFHVGSAHVRNTA